MVTIEQRRRCFSVPRHLSACARDALHRVTAKRVNGVVTQGWIYKDGLAPVAETDASGAVVSFFVYGTSPFSPDYMVRDGATYRLIRDFAGSVRLVVNADSGDIAQRLDYDSFGNVSQDTNPGFQPFGFKSGLYDSDTGLVHFGARWYDPTTGRWISKDPILLEGGLNLYAFCGNDPVNFSDPSGLWTVRIGGTASAGIRYQFNVNAGVAVGYTPSAGFTVGVNGGVGVGGGLVASASAGGFIEVTTANEVYDLSGTSVQVGASGGEGIVVGGDYLRGIDEGGKTTYQGGELNIGVGVGLPADIHFLFFPYSVSWATPGRQSETAGDHQK